MQGGYSDLYVPFCGHAIVEELTKRRTGVRDCMLTDVHQWGYQELQPHQVGEGVEKAREHGGMRTEKIHIPVYRMP